MSELRYLEEEPTAEEAAAIDKRLMEVATSDLSARVRRLIEDNEAIIAEAVRLAAEDR
jgi:hypothetical protein